MFYFDVFMITMFLKRLIYLFFIKKFYMWELKQSYGYYQEEDLVLLIIEKF